MTAKVKYQIATYSGVIEVDCDPDDEDEYIIAKAKVRLRMDAGEFPIGYQSFKVIDRSYRQ